MKCNGQKPRCSHCRTYEIDCTYTAPSRTHAPKKRRRQTKGEDDVSSTQDRLGRLESLVQRVTERLDVVERKDEVEPRFELGRASAMTTEIPLRVTSEEEQISPNSMVLPPLTQVLPIIQIYLHDFNSVLPLFDAGTLLQLVHSHYTVGPSQHDPVVGAAITVLVALAQRHDIAASHDVPSSAVCLSSAESVMSKVVLGDNLESARSCGQAVQQVVVGVIVFIFQLLHGYNLTTA